MSESPWTSDALRARMSVTRALDEQSPHSVARAMQRLELFDIIAAVDACTISADEALRQSIELKSAVMIDGV